VCKGGYGTVRIVDLLDFTAFKKHPKWIVGFSDVTVLHNHLNTLGLSIHGIMPITAPATNTQTIETLRMGCLVKKLSYCSSLEK
jgi:muramoyltetrapeptide carboxypeptidase